jgi:hypothetical protein
MCRDDGESCRSLRRDLAAANEAKERAERQRDALLAEARKQLAWWSKPEQPGMLLMEQVCDTIEEIIEALDDVGKEDESATSVGAASECPSN